MTKPKTKAAGAGKPDLTDDVIYENGKPVGRIALSGDTAEGRADGK